MIKNGQITTEREYAGLDITKMKAALDEAKLKFFPAYLWLVTKTLNQQEEFRIAEKDGQIGYYDYLTPLYASFHEYPAFRGSRSSILPCIVMKTSPISFRPLRPVNSWWKTAD